MAARRASIWRSGWSMLTFADTVFFTNSGAEAVECAIKTARAYHQHGGNPNRFEMITFRNAFHGRTMGTISASNQEKMHKGFKPLLPGFRYVEFDDLDEASGRRSVRKLRAS
jgi:acetylornithine/N-succinyldiaminopimelate aminotransferase